MFVAFAINLLDAASPGFDVAGANLLPNRKSSYVC